MAPRPPRPAVGALFGLSILVISLPFIRNAILAFGPPEFFALTAAAIPLIATVSARAPLKGLISGLMGMVIGFVGINTVVGGTRFTFGIPELSDGVQLVPALIGLFALPELFSLLKSNETISTVGKMAMVGVWDGFMEVIHRPALFFRSAALGTGIGLVPGSAPRSRAGSPTRWPATPILTRKALARATLPV